MLKEVWEYFSLQPLEVSYQEALAVGTPVDDIFVLPTLNRRVNTSSMLKVFIRKPWDLISLDCI